MINILLDQLVQPRVHIVVLTHLHEEGLGIRLPHLVLVSVVQLAGDVSDTVAEHGQADEHPAQLQRDVRGVIKALGTHS